MKTITYNLSYQLEYSQKLNWLYPVVLDTVYYAVDCIRFSISAKYLKLNLKLSESTIKTSR